jgi:hypothetical protein
VGGEWRVENEREGTKKQVQYFGEAANIEKATSRER